MATAAAQGTNRCQVLLMDAEAMNFKKQFDVLWSVESISHYQRLKISLSASRLLKPGVAFAIIDCSRKKIHECRTKKFIQPIEKACSVNCKIMDDYEQYLISNGLQITHREVLNKNCAKTWTWAWVSFKNRSFGPSPPNTAAHCLPSQSLSGHARRLRFRQFRLWPIVARAPSNPPRLLTDGEWRILKRQRRLRVPNRAN